MHVTSVAAALDLLGIVRHTSVSSLSMISSFFHRGSRRGTIPSILCGERNSERLQLGRDGERVYLVCECVCVCVAKRGSFTCNYV